MKFELINKDPSPQMSIGDFVEITSKNTNETLMYMAFSSSGICDGDVILIGLNGDNYWNVYESLDELNRNLTDRDDIIINIFKKDEYDGKLVRKGKREI